MEVLFVLIGVILGMILTLIYFASRSIGTIIIDQSDPMDEPYLFLDLDKPIESFMKQKHALIRIRKRNFISESK
jgi:hypothetical protein